jgi:hypothetical protein
MPETGLAGALALSAQGLKASGIGDGARVRLVYLD